MYDKILVPLALDHGLSQTLLGVARGLLAPGGEILALHVVEEAFGLARATQSPEQSAEVFERAHALIKERLAGVEGIKGYVLEGHVHRSILEFATEHEITCIVMGSHKPGLTDYLLGSTAARVVRHAPCSVHVHR